MTSMKRSRFHARSAGLLAMLLLGSLIAPRAVRAFPEPDSEFFVDLTGSVQGRDKMEISRTLRTAAETSRVHAMLVVVKAMSQYPDMPQNFPSFVNKVGQDWKIGDRETRRGMLVMFSLDDRKFGAVATTELNVPDVEDRVKRSMESRVLEALRGGRVGDAMRVAASNIAETLPTFARPGSSPGAAGPANRNQTTTTTTRRTVRPMGYRHNYGSSSGSGFGWIFGFIVLIMVISMVFSSFSGSRHGYGPGYAGGYYGGSSGGGPGFFSGMFTGGLLGWMFGGGGWGGYHHGGWGGYGGYNSYSDGYTEETTTTTSTSFGGGDSYGGSSDSGGSGFDSFGGGSFDGGGSFGEW